jgi:hypothetical protein
MKGYSMNHEIINDNLQRDGFEKVKHHSGHPLMFSKINDRDSTGGVSPRLHFWQIPEFFKCLVIGFCLTRIEQHRLLKKAKMLTKKATDFEMHEIIVASAESENRLSKKLDALLNRKFGKSTSCLLALSHHDFFLHFKEADASGDCVAELWATAVHPDMPIQLKRDIFAHIHMGMHFCGEQRLRMNRILARQKQTLDDLQSKIKKIAKQKRSLVRENERLRKEKLKLKHALTESQSLQTEQLSHQSGVSEEMPFLNLQVENKTLKKQCVELCTSMSQKQKKIKMLEGNNHKLETELSRQKELMEQFRIESRTLINQMMGLNSCDAQCPSFNLCQKRVLMVGGISRMESLFRDLIERSGGVFDYHDGYMKKGARKLEHRLKRADVVICPVNCNSHVACSLVKNLAKKYNKKVHMLANSSIQSFCQVIWGTSGNTHTLN